MRREDPRPDEADEEGQTPVQEVEEALFYLRKRSELSLRLQVLGMNKTNRTSGNQLHLDRQSMLGAGVKGQAQRPLGASYSEGLVGAVFDLGSSWASDSRLTHLPQVQSSEPLQACDLATAEDSPL